MPEVQYIRNFYIAKTFLNTPGVLEKQISGMPDQNPDECVIRALNFNGAANDPNLYLVWCNLTNDIVGSFCGGSLAPHFPQTTIRLNNPVPNMLEFKLYTPTVAGGMDQVSSLAVGDLAIHMDFIKYKRTPVHA